MKHVISSREGLVGYITLNRPEALNSLTHQMIGRIHAALRAHEADNAVDVIVIRSSVERAFCAGGDMKATRLMALDKKWDELQHFFKQEYELNLHIAQCKKPYVSLVNGIGMGGGLGLSVHGDVMVVDEYSRLAMPETAIGFFPDVGGTYFLSRLNHDAGLWMALSGLLVTGKECVAVGLATHCVPQTLWAELTNALEQDGSNAIKNTLPSLADTDLNEEFDAVLMQRKAWFDTQSQAQLLDNLSNAAKTNTDAAQLLKRVESMSPFAMDLARRLLQEAKDLSLEKCLEQELKAADEAVRHPDFVEGVRAVLVDKEKAVWTS